MKYPIIKSGLFRFSNSDKTLPSELSLVKVVKRILTSFGVAFIDKCCDNTNMYPVRFDNDNGTFQTFIGNAWVPIPGQLAADGLNINEWDGTQWNKVGTLNS